jgi:hypothetical protein
MEKKNEIAKSDEQVQLSSPQQIMKFANNLKQMIIENNLYTKIQGRNYVNVEGWQIAGAFTGTYPIVEKVENLSDEKKFKYRAEVSLRDKDGNVVGSGVAVCTNEEPGKRGFAEYAVASMAQTRAVGKAYRMKIGWLLKVAGYETTPAEEMDVINGEVVEPDSEKHAREVKEAIAKLKESSSMSDLRKRFASLKRDLVEDVDVQTAKDILKQQFGGDDE